MNYRPSEHDHSTARSLSIQPLSNVEARFVSAGPLRSFLIKLGIGEFLLVGTAAYLGSVVYHRLLLLEWPDPQKYVPAAVLLAILVSLVSLEFRHFATIQVQPRHQFLWNGVGAVALAFSFFLSTIFLLKTEDAYSRGSFLFQLASVGTVVLALRATAYSRLRSAIAAGKIESRRVVLIGDHEHCSQFAHRLSLTGVRIVRAFGLTELCDTGIMAAAGGSAATHLRELIAECRSTQGYRSPREYIASSKPAECPV